MGKTTEEIIETFKKEALKAGVSLHALQDRQTLLNLAQVYDYYSQNETEIFHYNKKNS